MFDRFAAMHDEKNVPVVQKGGFSIYERGRQAILVDHQIGNMFTMTFVLLIITSLSMVSGAFIIWTNILFGVLLLLSSGLFGYMAYSGIMRIKRKKLMHLDEQKVIVILDFGKGDFLDANGNRLAAIEEVKFTKGFQMTSSSPSIKASWNGNSIEVFSFNGLVGGSEAFISYFKEKGLWRS